MDRVPIKQLKEPEFISSGSTLLNLALGGGWPLSRIFNLVGDKSSGKTLIGIEGYANFNRQYPEGKMRYGEAEHALDERFAERIGLPASVERPEQLETVEDFERDVYHFLKNSEVPSLYILDSLDALSDEAEMKKMTKQLESSSKSQKDASEDQEQEGGKKQTGSYGMGKAKEMSRFFRLLAGQVEKTRCALGIISQVRDRVDVMFGETKTRSGGHALDHFASEIVWLSEVSKIEREVKGKKYIYGVNVLANVKKCKVGVPFKKVLFPIIFNYGVDDELSMMNYLSGMKELTEGETKDLKSALKKARELNDRQYILDNVTAPLKEKTIKVWQEIEATLAPPMRKYE